MPTPVIMPKYEMTQETGKIARWLKADGDVVEKGDPLLEVETDKVNMEVESRAAGVLTGICAEPGQVVPIGQPIAYIIKPGEAWPPAAAAPARRDTCCPRGRCDAAGEQRLRPGHADCRAHGGRARHRPPGGRRRRAPAAGSPAKMSRRTCAGRRQRRPCGRRQGEGRPGRPPPRAGAGR